LYDVLYGTDVVQDLATIQNDGGTRDEIKAIRRGLLSAVVDGLITDVQPRAAVAAPAAALDPAVEMAGERALVPDVLPFVASGRTWANVRLGIITEFGGLADGTRVALARANAFYRSLEAPTFRNVTRATRVHPDLNAAFVRAEASLAAQLAATPQPRRTELTNEITTVLGRSTWSAVLRENRNSPHRLSDHSFGFAIDIDSPRNPNIGKGAGLDAVQGVTGRNPRVPDTAGQNRAQIETAAEGLATNSDEYVAAMTSEATLAPVLLRLANAARARVQPPLPPLASGDPLVAAIVLATVPARDAALRAAIWPEAPAPAAPPPAPAGGGRRRRVPAAPAAPAPPADIAAAERSITVIGNAFRGSFVRVGRPARTGAATEGTAGSVAAHGFMNLPPILVGALAGSDAGNLRWLGTSNRDFMHFELMTRPALYVPGAIADPAPPAAAGAAAGAPAPAGAPGPAPAPAP
jgi:hypothetical protein